MTMVSRLGVRGADPGSVGKRLFALATKDPDQPAVTSLSPTDSWTTISRAELCRRVAATAEVLDAAAGDDVTSTVIALPNGTDFIVAVLATWWTGRTPLVIPPGSTPQELQALFRATGSGTPGIEVSEELLGSVRAVELDELGPFQTPQHEPPVAWNLPSGGSTGLPSLIPVQGTPAAVLNGQQSLLAVVGWRPAATQFVIGPLFHAAPFTSAFSGIAAGNHLVIPGQFAPAVLEEAAALAPPTWCQLTPHQMALIGGDESLAGVFCGKLDGIMHTAAPCPADVKREWIARLGAERVFEMYGSTQMVGAAICNGAEWLERPGTVGRPFMTQIRIFSEEGRRLGPGLVGEVTMRSMGTRRITPSAAAHVRAHPGGFYGVGDLGYLDSEGYLFLTDRLDDVIIVGGANVSAREVENALTSHPAVREAIVSGRSHDLLGQTVHAAVVRTPNSVVTAAELRTHCAGLLAAHKVPSVEIVEELARSRAGKVQRFRYGG